MKFRSQVYTAVSGSIGGVTYSHNRGGMYTRGRATPTNPNSAAQQAARNAFGSLATAWSGILTQAQRDGWTLYATNTPLTDAFGEPLTLTGQQMYNRCNTPRLRSGEARVDAFPVTFGQANLTQAMPTWSTPTLSVYYDNTDAWANAVGGFLIIQTSPIVGPAINFHKAPFRWLTNEDGAVVPPTAPKTTAVDAFGNTLSAFIGNRTYVKIRASDADGRLSPTQTFMIDLV